MYMKKIHQFLSSTKKKHEKRKLVLFFCLTVYIKLHRFMGAHQRNKVVKNLAMPPPKKNKLPQYWSLEAALLTPLRHFANKVEIIDRVQVRVCPDISKGTHFCFGIRALT